MAAHGELGDERTRLPLLPYPRRAISSLLVISLPMAAIFGGLAANAGVSPATALLSWAGMTVLSGLVIRRHMLSEWRVRSGSARSGVPETVAPPAAEQHLLLAALNGLDMPLLTFDGERRIGIANDAARAVLGNVVSGREITTAIRDPDMLAAVDEVIETGEVRTVEFRRSQPVDRILHARVERLPPNADASAEADMASNHIIMFDDMTDSQRMREVRSGFVADVSHELRTPLAAVVSIVETLNGAARDDPKAQTRFMAMLDEQANRMARIVDDLLSLSRIEMSEHRPPQGVAELGEVIGSIVESAGLLAKERGVRIEVRQEQPVPVMGDGLELSRLFQNLVDNAVKYGDPESVVTVSVATSEDLAIVSVTDQGAGIERIHLPRLTERFYRVDKGRSRAAGGTGLGLAIVKHVVSRHRGRLKIESEVGKGSTFTVELPLAHR